MDKIGSSSIHFLRDLRKLLLMTISTHLDCKDTFKDWTLKHCQESQDVRLYRLTQVLLLKFVLKLMLQPLNFVNT